MSMSKLERDANTAAELLPMTNDDERPALRLPTPDGTGQVLVFGYWKDGELVVSADTEESLTAVTVRFALNDDRKLAIRTDR
jgi:hypothetical protein